MEKLTPKHNHTLTDILKVCIFAIFLLMPFFTMLPTMLYYGFNEHAKGIETVTEGGWQVTEKFESNEINNANDLILGNVYHMDTLILNGQTMEEEQFDTIDIVILKFASTENTFNDMSIDETYSQGYDSKLNNGLEVLYDPNGITILYTNTATYTAILYTKTSWTEQMKFNEVEFYINDNLNDFKTLYDYDIRNHNIEKSTYQDYNYIYTEELEVQKNITQLIEKNWNDLWDTNLYKWTNESILKEGLDNFTGVFGITNTSHITNLITYELIIVSIYIVIDIVLKMFTWLTHMIGNK